MAQFVKVPDSRGDVLVNLDTVKIIRQSVDPTDDNGVKIYFKDGTTLNLSCKYEDLKKKLRIEQD